jgi:predicted nucleic acid-binding protein
LKLWLLDADIIIDLLAYDLFDSLANQHDIYVAETVINEVEYYKVRGNRIPVDLKKEYLEAGKIKQLSISSEAMISLLNRLPRTIFDGLDEGEQESLAALVEHQELRFCTCDKAAIIALPFLGCTERGISAEILLKQSGLTSREPQEKHTEKYFRRWLHEGEQRKIYGI